MERIEPTIGARSDDAPQPIPRDQLVAAQRRSGRRWLALLALLAGASAVAWWLLARAPATPPAPPARVEAPAPAVAVPAIEHPLPPPPAAAPPLPDLAGSDALLAETLVTLAGAGPVQQLLVTQGFVRRTVAFIDNLPRSRLPRGNAPVRPAAGAFRVSGRAESLAIDPANAARYAPFVALAEAVDPARLVEAYVRLYPLFQQAYEELGYPQGYFNDRLMQVIDHLLQTPLPAGPLRLTQPKVFYEFADPRLEALSAGQKALLRTGPEQAQRLMARLRAVQAELRRSAAAR